MKLEETTKELLEILTDLVDRAEFDREQKKRAGQLQDAAISSHTCKRARKAIAKAQKALSEQTKTLVLESKP